MLFPSIRSTDLLEQLSRMPIKLPMYDYLDFIPKELKEKEFFPFYNEIEIDPTHVIIEVALAGYTKDQIEITSGYDPESDYDRSLLTIKGTSKSEESESEIKYIKKGISTRSFKRDFILEKYETVTDVKFENGILIITLEKQIPEKDILKKIEIK